jgi:hypothetical protein
MEPGRERRQYPRVSLNHVTVEVYSETGRITTSQFCFIINVSENGMLFKADVKGMPYDPDSDLRITFVLPDNNIVVRTDAAIIHVRLTELSQYVGIQFKNVDAEQAAMIREFVGKMEEID